jgi:hypothetical protein
MNSEVDVNILVNLYNQKISTLTNQNILLEAKLQSLTKDFEEQKNVLLTENLNLQNKYDELKNSKKIEK